MTNGSRWWLVVGLVVAVVLVATPTDKPAHAHEPEVNEQDHGEPAEPASTDLDAATGLESTEQGSGELGTHAGHLIAGGIITATFVGLLGVDFIRRQSK